MKRKDRSILGTICIILGLLLLMAALVLTGYNLWDANRADTISQENLEQLKEAVEDKTKDEDTSAGELSSEREMPAVEINGYRYIGWIDVDSVGIHLPIMEEWDMTRLKIAPCRYSGTVYQNNMVIAGHNYRKHFSRLRWADAGTELTFTDTEGNVYSYVIAGVEILDPDQVEEMTEDSEDWDLTLFTCTTGGQTRYTIRCIRND